MVVCRLRSSGTPHARLLTWPQLGCDKMEAFPMAVSCLALCSIGEKLLLLCNEGAFSARCAAPHLWAWCWPSRSARRAHCRLDPEYSVCLQPARDAGHWPGLPACLWRQPARDLAKGRSSKRRRNRAMRWVCRNASTPVAAAASLPCRRCCRHCRARYRARSSRFIIPTRCVEKKVQVQPICVQQDKGSAAPAGAAGH